MSEVFNFKVNGKINYVDENINREATILEVHKYHLVIRVKGEKKSRVYPLPGYYDEKS